MVDGKNRNHESNGKASPQNSQTSHDSQFLILPPRGDYQTLLSYQKSEVVYEITFRFCRRFLKKSDRTIDQRVQAARSGKQNIVLLDQQLKALEKDFLKDGGLCDR